MNAKITITVPIQKVHLKIADMLEESAQTLEAFSIDVTAISKSVAQQADVLGQLEKIDALRKELALLDANFEDCYNVLNGLIVYKTQQSETKQEVKQDAIKGT